MQFCLPALLQGNKKRNDMFVQFSAALGDIHTWQRHSLLRPTASTVRIRTVDLVQLTLQLMCCCFAAFVKVAGFILQNISGAEEWWRSALILHGKCLPKACVLVSGVIVQTVEFNPLSYIILKLTRVLQSTVTKFYKFRQK